MTGQLAQRDFAGVDLASPATVQKAHLDQLATAIDARAKHNASAIGPMLDPVPCSELGLNSGRRVLLVVGAEVLAQVAPSCAFVQFHQSALAAIHPAARQETGSLTLRRIEQGAYRSTRLVLLAEQLA